MKNDDNCLSSSSTRGEVYQRYLFEDEDLEPKEFEDEILKDDMIEKNKYRENPYLNDAKYQSTFYYDETENSNYILEYQKSLVFDDEGRMVSCDRALEAKIVENITKICNGVINRKKRWIFVNHDELLQETVKECYRYIPKYNPESGRSFSLFCKIADMHSLAYTMKDRNNRECTDVDEEFEIENHKEINYNIFFDDMEDTLEKIIDENFLKENRRKYKEMAVIMMKYIRENQGITQKNDMSAFFRGEGKKISEFKDFINAITPYKHLLYELAN
jgi:hypothetical protein